MKHRTVLITVFVALVAAALLVTYAAMWREPHPDGLQKVSVRLKWLHQAQFAGFYTAAQRGLYRRERLDVTLNPGGIDFPAVQAVAGGSEQFGVTGADQLLLARAKGVPVVAVAVLYRKNPMVLFSLANSGITEPRAFVGKRVGVKLGGNEELTYRALLKKVEVDPTQITEVPVKYDMTPLFTGEVDVWPGYAINEPLIAEARGHDVNVIWPSDYDINLYADTLFTSESIIANQPDLVEGFVRATIEGWQYAVDYPQEAVEYTLIYSDRLDREHQLRMMKTSIPLLRPDKEPIGTMNLSVWSEMQQLLLEQGFMKSRVELSEAFTTRFLPANVAE